MVGSQQRVERGRRSARQRTVAQTSQQILDGHDVRSLITGQNEAPKRRGTVTPPRSLSRICDHAVTSVVRSANHQDPLSVYVGTGVASSASMNDAMRSAGWTVAAALVALLGAAGASQGCREMHPPTERDEFYYLVAVTFDVPELCGRIDPLADGSTYGWSTGHKVRTKRSVCFSNLKLPASARDPEVPTPMSAAGFAAQVRALGYDDSAIAQAAYDENYLNSPIYAAYKQLLTDKEFRRRLRAGRSYQEPLDQSRVRRARPIEFLYQMAAIDGREPALCSRVSPNAVFTDFGGGRLLLKCYLHLAFNTRDAALCDSLPTAGPSLPVNNMYYSREQCRKTVAVYKRPGFPTDMGYGPSPFPHVGDFELSLREIGYTVDELPPVRTATPGDYWGFVSRLKFSGPPDARAEFIRRVTAMK